MVAGPVMRWLKRNSQPLWGAVVSVLFATGIFVLGLVQGGNLGPAISLTVPPNVVQDVGRPSGVRPEHVYFSAIAAVLVLLSGVGIYLVFNRQAKTEKALRRSEQSYRLLFENSAEAALVIDGQGCFAAANLEAEQLAGYGRTQLVGRRLAELLPAIDRERCDRAEVPGKERGAVECLLIRHDNTSIPVECVTRGLPGGYAHLSLRDITAQKREQEEMRRSHGELTLELIKTDTTLREETAARRRADETLRAVVHAAPLGIIALDSDRRIRMWSRAAESMFAWREDEVFGKPLPLVPAHERAEYETLLDQVETGGSAIGQEKRWLRKDGSLLVVGLSATVLRNKAGKIDGTLILLSDRSERKAFEQQIQQSQKMEAIGQLAGGVAHDFNNLLTIINGYADLALPQLQTENPVRMPLQEIRKAGDRAAALTKQLLAFSRKQLLQPRVLDLNAVVTDVNKMLRRLIGEDMNLQMALGGNLGHVKADPGQLEQILINLAVNARDAMPRGGRLTIETRNVDLGENATQNHVEVPAGQYVLLAVSDTGCGMTPHVQQHLFEPFFTTKAPGKGTGLGLATVYGIVKQSGGHISVYSEQSIGTTFKIYLPRLDAGAELAPPAEEAVAPRRGSETVLIAEDEPAVQAFTHEVLRSYGYQVMAAGSGEEALRLADEFGDKIDLLVTDVVMPGMSGRTLANSLHETWPGIKVLFLSGYTDTAMLRHGVLEDDVDFLHKPFRPDELARAVREVLDKRISNGGQPIARPKRPVRPVQEEAAIGR